MKIHEGCQGSRAWSRQGAGMLAGSGLTLGYRSRYGASSFWASSMLTFPVPRDGTHTPFHPTGSSQQPADSSSALCSPRGRGKIMEHMEHADRNPHPQDSVASSFVSPCMGMTRPAHFTNEITEMTGWG